MSIKNPNYPLLVAAKNTFHQEFTPQKILFPNKKLLTNSQVTQNVGNSRLDEQQSA
jgi:hypothetical protein